jgi:hypothetical protein
MTGTPNYPWDDQIGRYVVWTICTGPNQSDCSNVEDVYNSLVSPTASWGSATAGFDTTHELNGYRITARLVDRYPDPNWVPGLYDPDDPNTWAPVIEKVIPTYTESIVMDTAQRDQIHPAIELYDGAAGASSVAGIIDGTYYIYPVVFQDAKFCYLPRCSGTGANFTGEVCAYAKPIPLEPYFPDCKPPVYPLDSITQWIPSIQTEELITYTATWNFYVNDSGESDNQVKQSRSITLNQTVYAPSNDWASMLQSYIKTYTYFGNGIYH